MEETGLSAVSMEHFMDLHTSNSVTDEWGQVFLARNLTQGKAQPEDSEELQTKRLSLENILAAIEAKEITDAITVAAIYKLAYLKTSISHLPNLYPSSGTSQMRRANETRNNAHH